MILVIGAGAAGLAVAHALQARGLDYRVLEKGRIGETWAHHYDTLRLHTLKGNSALPGLPMPDDYPDFPDAAQVQAYLKTYADHFRLNVSEGVTVSRATWGGPYWHIETSEGDMRADMLMVTTGIWNAPVIPCLDGLNDFRGQTLHSSVYRNAQPFVGERVLVVGVGNSGSEIAVQLSKSDIDTSIVIRDGAAFISKPESAASVEAGAKLLRTLPRKLAAPLFKRAWGDFRDVGIAWPSDPPLAVYPVVGYELPEAIRAGRVKQHGAIDRFTQHGVRFVDGEAADFDVIIFATGYRPTIDFIDPKALKLNSVGWPVLDATWRSVVNPKLACVGFTYPGTEGWLQSIGRFAKEAVEGIAHARDRTAGF